MKDLEHKSQSLGTKSVSHRPIFLIFFFLFFFLLVCTHTRAGAHTHTKRKRKEKESEIMNRKEIVESNEKQEAVMKDNPVKNIHLPYKCFFESSFSLSKMEVVEVQRRRYKGYQILGAKLLSEKKRKHGKNILLVLWVKPVRWFINWLCLSVF